MPDNDCYPIIQKIEEFHEAMNGGKPPIPDWTQGVVEFLYVIVREGFNEFKNLKYLEDQNIFFLEYRLLPTAQKMGWVEKLLQEKLPGVVVKHVFREKEFTRADLVRMALDSSEEP